MEDVYKRQIRFLGQPVLGGTELLSGEHSDAWVVNNVASTMNARRRVWHKLDSLGVNSYTLVHPLIDTAQAEIGMGSVVQDGVILSPGVRIGRHCLINIGAIVAHESVVEDVCFLGPGAILNGRVHIKEASFLGAGCIIPVSYTHLDVYKRQFLAGGFRSPPWRG